MSILQNTTKLQGCKCVVVGDESVGKSSVIVTYTTKCFPRDEITETFEVFEKTSIHIPMGETIMNMEIWDTPAQDSYAKLRALTYSQCDVLVVCFSIASPPTFENVFRTWFMELSQICPEVPIILVGCKSDLRHSESSISRLQEHGMKPITTRQGQRLADQLAAKCYVECSAANMDKLNNVFEEACRAVINSRALPKSKQLANSCPTTTNYGSLRFKKLNLENLEGLMDEEGRPNSGTVQSSSARQRSLSLSENQKEINNDRDGSNSKKGRRKKFEVFSKSVNSQKTRSNTMTSITTPNGKSPRTPRTPRTVGSASDPGPSSRSNRQHKDNGCVVC